MNSPTLKPSSRQPIRGPQRPESPAVCLWAQGLLPMGPTLCHLLITKEENNEFLPSYTYQR